MSISDTLKYNGTGKRIGSTTASSIDYEWEEEKNLKGWSTYIEKEVKKEEKIDKMATYKKFIKCPDINKPSYLRYKVR